VTGVPTHKLKEGYQVFPGGEKLHPKNEEKLLLELPDLGWFKRSLYERECLGRKIHRSLRMKGLGGHKIKTDGSSLSCIYFDDAALRIKTLSPL
jgi:hypothetical protein